MKEELIGFDAIQKTAAVALEVALSTIVNDSTTADMANKSRLELGKIEKKIASVAKELKEPFREKIDEIAKIEKSLAAKVGGGKKHLESVLYWYQVEIRMAAEKAAEEARQRAAEKLAAQIDDSASFDEQIAAEERLEMQQAPVILTKTEAPMALRSVWKFRVVDKSKLPIEYLTPDEVLIGQRVRAANNPLRQLDGLEIWEEQVPTGR